jgi:trimethyllysine dioxygenase
VTADLTFADRAYTQLALGAHTDTAYLKNSAGLELFHVIRKPADGGGKSLLVDGFYCANKLKQLEPNDFEFLSQTKIEMISYKEDSCHFRHFAPVIKTDSFTGELEQIR